MDKELAQVYEEIVEIAKKEVAKTKSSAKWGTAVAASSSGKVEVMFDDGDTATPCDTLAKVHAGDRVMLSVDAESRRATVTGNYSDPAASDSEVRVVNDAVERAATKADAAGEAAAQAIESASEAYIAAIAAQTSAEEAASDAQTAAAAANAAVERADNAYESARAAEAYAGAADDSAREATAHAVGALNSLSTVYDVVGMLNWISEHGTFVPTEDTEVMSGKFYFAEQEDYVHTRDTEVNHEKTYYSRSGEGTEESPYEYTVVENPTLSALSSYYELTTHYVNADVQSGDPNAMGLYEFTGELDETVQNYLASHLALTDEGLWITKDGTGCHLLLSGDRLSFRGSDGQEVAYIAVDPDTNESTFYMTKAVVVKNLRFANWEWRPRDNGNLSLKWVGK